MPPLRIDWKACSTVRLSPIASNEKSTPPPPVRSRICSTGSPAVASTLCVAPRSRAVRSLCSSTSTAMIIRAPAMRAPWITDRPTPPAPYTATVEPGFTRAVLRAAPTPVVTPQPISAAMSNGTSLSIGTTPLSCSSICSA